MDIAFFSLLQVFYNLTHAGGVILKRSTIFIQISPPVIVVLIKQSIGGYFYVLAWTEVPGGKL
jgi:hypothetical protein